MVTNIMCTTRCIETENEMNRIAFLIVGVPCLTTNTQTTTVLNEMMILNKKKKTTKAYSPMNCPTLETNRRRTFNRLRTNSQNACKAADSNPDFSRTSDAMRKTGGLRVCLRVCSLLMAVVNWSSFLVLHHHTTQQAASKIQHIKNEN